MKIIKISNCGGCPRPTKYNMKMKNVCQFKYIELDNFPVIPEWCPLDEQDLTPALELLLSHLDDIKYDRDGIAYVSISAIKEFLEKGL